MRTPIERASPTDRAFLAMDTTAAPEQFGAVLLLASSTEFDLALARRTIAQRLAAVPRLRQRLVRTPFACGGPMWIDDPGFDIARHVKATACPAPGDERALLDFALSVVMTPLPRSAPLWSAVFITGLTDGGVALLIVLHHVLADGLGGLMVLTSLADGPAHGPGSAFPRPAPSAARLFQDAWRERLRALRRAGRAWHLLRASITAGGGLRPERVAPSSLNQRTGSRRRLAVVRTDRASLRAAAHRHGATTNDAVLVAVAGALHRVLIDKGESIDKIVITVPVSGRDASANTLGNSVSPMLVAVPTAGSVHDRLAHVAAQVRAGRAAATGPPPIALLGWLFRPLARLGGYRWYMNHQHRFHTLITHVRGPAEPVTFGGSPITSAIPIAHGLGGNIPVYFEVLSYAGTLAITVTVDPDHFAELNALIAALHGELELLVSGTQEHGDVLSDTISGPGC